MARYDVFLVNALADSEKAVLIVRRLRALKFKVRYDNKREHTTPTPKDYRDTDNSQTQLHLRSSFRLPQKYLERKLDMRKYRAKFVAQLSMVFDIWFALSKLAQADSDHSELHLW